MALYYRLHAVDCAERAANRAAAILHRELGRGTSGLQAIAYTAPLLGMFGTAMLLMNIMRVYFGSACGLCESASGPAEALVPIALSIPVAILACAGFHCLRHQVETLDLEMHTATLGLLNDLARLG